MMGATDGSRRGAWPVKAVLVAGVRVGLAGVWLHQGLWAKVLGGRPDHQSIVADAPGIGRQHARPVTVAIGLGESALAGWVLSGMLPRRAAAVQTALLVGMNAGGLLFARDRIADPFRMVLRNAVLVSAAWGVAAAEAKR